MDKTLHFVELFYSSYRHICHQDELAIAKSMTLFDSADSRKFIATKPT